MTAPDVLQSDRFRGGGGPFVDTGVAGMLIELVQPLADTTNSGSVDR